jgi:hypothetical protein
MNGCGEDPRGQRAWGPGYDASEPTVGHLAATFRFRPVGDFQQLQFELEKRTPTDSDSVLLPASVHCLDDRAQMGTSRIICREDSARCRKLWPLQAHVPSFARPTLIIAITRA